MSKPSITVADVKGALETVARADPDHVDRRPAEGLPSRYVEQGKPACLVARALARLGFSVGVLKALDAERPVGELLAPGVRVEESRHPALRKLDPMALRLLQYVQDQQDSGRRWGRVVGDAFTTSVWRGPFDRRRKPWLFTDRQQAA